MKICVAQIHPTKGNIEKNILRHLKIIDRAITYDVDLIVFPELSITGYEPGLSKALATFPEDSRLDVFQQKANDRRINICVGIPIQNITGICISMLIFQPYQAVQVYAKKYLHADEVPYFVSGENSMVLQKELKEISFAICYEISVLEHSAKAAQNGASIYIASVAKTLNGIKKAAEHLSNISKKYSMITFMSNAIGHCDNFECGGKSAIWNKEGKLIGQLDDKSEGILILDIDTRTVREEYYSKT